MLNTSYYLAGVATLVDGVDPVDPVDKVERC